MRPTAVIPLVFTLVAFILALLCVFAGSKSGYMENANLLTVMIPVDRCDILANGSARLIPRCWEILS